MSHFGVILFSDLVYQAPGIANAAGTTTQNPVFEPGIKLWVSRGRCGLYMRVNVSNKVAGDRLYLGISQAPTWKDIKVTELNSGLVVRQEAASANFVEFHYKGTKNEAGREFYTECTIDGASILPNSGIPAAPWNNRDLVKTGYHVITRTY